jgi:hypothetical protein
MKRIRRLVNKHKGWFVAAAILPLIFGWGAYAHFIQGRTWIDWVGVETKTLWGLMELLIVPAALVWVAWWLNRTEKETEREIAAHKRYDATLEGYFDRMTTLLLREGLRDSKRGDEVREVARTRALAAFRILDGNHKGQVVQFLHESRLISASSPIIYLNKADLKDVNLVEAELREVDLNGTDLRRAKMCKVHLMKSKIRGADLRHADLQFAHLQETDLRKSDLRGTNLAGANLRAANLCGACNLAGANLEGAKLRETRVLARDVDALKRAGANLDRIVVIE